MRVKPRTIYNGVRPSAASVCFTQKRIWNVIGKYAALAFWYLLSLSTLAITNPLSADPWSLISSPGVCTYTYDRVRDETTTECSAVALLMDLDTSEIVRCSGYVEGNQGMAPSVEENVPDAIVCRAVGRVMAGEGPFGIASLDDAFIEENTKIRRRGQYVWSNAFWVYSTSGELDVRLCAARRTIQNPDFAQSCSRTVNWPDR
ncbi:MAG: hypothetical protein AAF619_07905 [Pseudomonadota bacterium]